MTEEQWLKKLKEDGYENIRVCEVNTKGEITPEHTHDLQTVHVILEGEVTLIDNQELKLTTGDFFEIPKDTTHKVITPENGCKMIVGEKS